MKKFGSDKGGTEAFVHAEERGSRRRALIGQPPARPPRDRDTVRTAVGRGGRSEWASHQVTSATATPTATPTPTGRECHQ